MSEQSFVEIVNEWEQTFKPATLLTTENNVNEIMGYIRTIKHGAVTIQNLCLAVEQLGDIENGGRLQYHHAPQAVVVQPAPVVDSMPHADVRELADFNYTEDFRDTKKVAKFLRESANATGGTNDVDRYKFLQNAFVERQRFIKERSIRKPEVASAAPASPKSLPEFLQSTENMAMLADVKNSIERFKCATPAKTQAVRQLLKDTFNALITKGTPARQVKAVIVEKMVDYLPANSSIR